MYKNGSYKKILIVLFLVIIILFGAYFLAFQDIKAKNEHASLVLSDLSQQSVKQEYLLSMQRTLNNIDPDISRINDSIVAKDGDVTFIEHLESIAHNNGLVIEIVSLDFVDDPARASNDLEIFRIKAKAHGGWSSTYAFLAELESLSFKTKVSQFSLLNSTSDVGVDGKTSNVWQSSFQIEVLKYK